jgi:Protein of unknown function (DUF3253)
MIFAEEIRKTILRLAKEMGKERSFAAADVARELDQNNWPELLDQVKLVAESLTKEGKIEIIAMKSSAENSDLRFKQHD